MFKNTQNEICNKVGPLSHEVNVDGQILKGHAEQLLRMQIPYQKLQKPKQGTSGPPEQTLPTDATSLPADTGPSSPPGVISDSPTTTTGFRAQLPVLLRNILTGRGSLLVGGSQLRIEECYV